MRLIKLALTEKVHSAIMDAVDMDNLPFDNLFDGENSLRRVIPLTSNKLSSLISLLENGETKTGKSYKVDLESKLVTDETGRKMRIGKIIQKELGQERLIEWGREVTGMGKSIVLSRHPVDIARMSDHDRWSSCHAPDHKNNTGYHAFSSALEEAESGGPIAYVIETKDLEKIDLSDEEVFKDDERGIDGIVPLSRVRLNRYSNEDDNEDLAVPVIKVYGDNNEGFLDSVTKWVRDKQAPMLGDGMPDMDSYVRRGGTYADFTEDSALFNAMYDTDQYKGGVEHSGGSESVIAMWESEIKNIDNDERYKTENVQLYANVDTYDDNVAYMNISGSIVLEFHEATAEAIAEIVKSGTLGNEFLENYEFEALLQPELYISDVHDVSFDVSGDNIEIRIGFDYEGDYSDGPFSPDDYRYIKGEAKKWDENHYDAFYHKIYKKMVKAGAINDYFQEDVNLIKSTPFQTLKFDKWEEPKNEEEYVAVLNTPSIPIEPILSVLVDKVKISLVPYVTSVIKGFVTDDMLKVGVGPSLDFDKIFLPKVVGDFDESALDLKKSMTIYFDFNIFNYPDDYLKRIIEIFSLIDKNLPLHVNEIREFAHSEYLKLLDQYMGSLAWENGVMELLPDDFTEAPGFSKKLTEMFYVDMVKRSQSAYAFQFFHLKEKMEIPEFQEAFYSLVVTEKVRAEQSEKTENPYKFETTAAYDMLEDLKNSFPKFYARFSQPFNSQTRNQEIIQSMNNLLGYSDRYGWNKMHYLESLVEMITDRESYIQGYNIIKNEYIRLFHELPTTAVGSSYFPDILTNDPEVLKLVMSYIDEEISLGKISKFNIDTYTSNYHEAIRREFRKRDGVPDDRYDPFDGDPKGKEDHNNYWSQKGEFKEPIETNASWYAKSLRKTSAL